MRVSIRSFSKVDVIRRVEGSGELVLGIRDDLAWGEDAHLFMITQKIDAYLKFIDSGQYLHHADATPDDRVRIELVATHEPDKKALDFLFDLGARLAKRGLAFTYKVDT